MYSAAAGCLNGLDHGPGIGKQVAHYRTIRIGVRGNQIGARPDSLHRPVQLLIIEIAVHPHQHMRGLHRFIGEYRASAGDLIFQRLLPNHQHLRPAVHSLHFPEICSRYRSRSHHFLRPGFNPHQP
ncbi:hypothetical protein D3C73_1217840 [compost metagenome]